MIWDTLGKMVTLFTAMVTLVIVLKGQGKLTEMHLMMNSRLDQLLKAMKQEGFNEGVKSETDKTDKNDVKL